jgi:GT2 family glycosyltransferase
LDTNAHFGSISAVIVTWNQPELLKNCLTSLIFAALADGVDLQIIVVANGSPAPIVQFVHSDFPQIEIIAFHEPQSFTKANNAGFERAQGDYVLQLNDDTVVHPGALRSMVRLLQQNPAVGAVGPRLSNPDGTIQIRYFSATFPAWYDTASELLGLNRAWPNNPLLRRRWYVGIDYGKSRPVDQVAGACLLYRKQLLRELGGLDENIRYFFDDVDICSRIWKSGSQVWYCADAVVTHYGGQSFKKRGLVDIRELWYPSLVYYYRKHQGVSQRVIVFACLWFALVVRGGISFFYSLSPSNRQKGEWRRLASAYWRLSHEAFATGAQPTRSGDTDLARESKETIKAAR